MFSWSLKYVEHETIFFYFDSVFIIEIVEFFNLKVPIMVMAPSTSLYL